MSICLECNSSKLRGLKRKWIRCSAQATVLHLKKFIAKKLNLTSFNREGGRDCCTLRTHTHTHHTHTHTHTTHTHTNNTHPNIHDTLTSRCTQVHTHTHTHTHTHM